MSASIRDDSLIEEEPLVNADYLSHPWLEEDLWSTRRYILRKGAELENATRLENALWRAWRKKASPSGTLSSQKINWDRDSDITWLYGPWQRSTVQQARASSAGSQRNIASSIKLPKKPALKNAPHTRALSQTAQIRHSVAGKHSQRVSSVIRHYHSPRVPQRSRSGAAVTRLVRYAARCAKLGFGLSSSSSFSSRNGDYRIRFDTEVRQCVSVNPAKGISECRRPRETHAVDNYLQLPNYEYVQKPEIQHAKWNFHPSIEHIPPTTLKRPVEHCVTFINRQM